MKKRDRLINNILLFPALFSFGMAMVIPFIIGMVYSFTDWNGYSISEFLGIENYTNVIHDESFLYAFGLTFLFTFISMIAVNIVSFTLATLVTQKMKGIQYFRAAFFLPNLIGGLILGYIWQFIFNGIVFDIFQYSPLSTTESSIFALIFVMTWQYSGYIMLIYVTALLNIPEELIEASEIDGASKFKQFIYIKLPMLAGAFTITLFLTVISGFKQYDVIYSLTSGGPSYQLSSGTIVNGTQTLAVDIYQRAFTLKSMSEAQAEAVIFAIVLAVITLIQVSITKRREIES